MQTNTIESLGERIIKAAQLAAAAHLEHAADTGDLESSLNNRKNEIAPTKHSPRLSFARN